MNFNVKNFIKILILLIECLPYAMHFIGYTGRANVKKEIRKGFRGPLGPVRVGDAE